MKARAFTSNVSEEQGEAKSEYKFYVKGEVAENFNFRASNNAASAT
jgi:hypothetical protein